MKKFNFLTSLKGMALAAIAIAASFNSADAQILYKVEKGGDSKPSYLLGTHHMAHLGVVDSIAELPAIMSEVDKVYGEFDMSKLSDPATIMAMQASLQAPADSTLDKVLSPEQLARLTDVWQQFTGGAAPIEMMYPMKPCVMNIQLAAIMTAKVFPDLNPMEGIDVTMQNRAREAGKAVDGLETMEYQLNLLYNSPIAEQAEDLMKTVDDIEGEEKKAIELAEAYARHDIDTIGRLTEESMANDPSSAEKILFTRNANWIAILTDKLPAESALVVVGAAHLPGEKGLLEGLQKAGFTVTPID